MQPNDTVTMINIDLLIPSPYQPRRIFNDESLKELSSSIKEFGILNPILVRKKDNLYEIIAGERRYRAAKLANIKEVPVIIKNVEEKDIAKIALIENLQRENINPIEEAKSYQQILKVSNIKEEELSNIIGKSQSYISNKIRLLKLPQNIQDALANKKISERHARSLININDSKLQTELLNRVINEKLTVKELETIINEKQITDEEIKSAINDIMKTLNIDNELTDDKKEEKESDKMNNESFFSTNPNNLGDSQNMTLNSMNMQSLNNNPNFVSQPTMPQNEQNIISNFEQPEQNIIYNEPSQVLPEAPQMTTPSPIPNFESSPMPEVTMPISNLEPPLMPPTYESQNSIQTNVTSEPAAYNPVITPEFPNAGQMLDQPIFNPNMATPSQLEPSIQPDSLNIPTPSYEIPVDSNINHEIDKLTEVETLLNNNGINYKKYSNEIGHCIIIEL